MVTKTRATAEEMKCGLWVHFGLKCARIEVMSVYSFLPIISTKELEPNRC